MYTFGTFSQKKVSKNFCWWEIDLKPGPTHQKVKISCRPNIGMWGVSPEAMAWNVGAVHSDFNLGERISSGGHRRANLRVHFKIGPLAKNPISIHKVAAKNANGFLKTLYLTLLTRPNQ